MRSGVAFYLRLSTADGDLGKDHKDESNSIENQRLLLQHFVDGHEELAGSIKEYIDDGYTGTNFDRPAFRKMIEDAKGGSIGTILVKDLSRLGRDYIGVGDYLEQIFPVLGIRFIAVNSNYDSDRYIGKTMGMDMAVSNVVNSLYSRDISKKRKSAKQTRWKQGLHTSGRVPYGYIKDKSARGGWRIDAEAAEIVKLIFDKANANYTTRMIADLLNDRGVITPGDHRKAGGVYGGIRKVPDAESLWDVGMIRTILHRYEYTGAFVQNRREQIHFGLHVTRKVPAEQQYITEDGHDAIVTREEYESAQAAMKAMSRSSFRKTNEYPLKGRLRCGICRLAMTYMEASWGPVYYCAHRVKVGRYSECSSAHFPAKQIDSIVLGLLHTQLKALQELERGSEEKREEDIQNTAIECRRIEQTVQQLKKERTGQYEAYAEGRITFEAYMDKKAELTVQIETWQNRLDRIRSRTEKGKAQSKELSQLLLRAQNSMESDTLTKEMAEAFIKTVYVYDQRKVSVEFIFDGLIAEAEENVKG